VFNKCELNEGRYKCKGEYVTDLMSEYMNIIFKYKI
jgi:hypothetical protein